MKQKSHSSTKKRVRFTGTGKPMTLKSSKNHLLSNKSKKMRKKGVASHGIPLHKSQEKRIKKLLPNKK